MLNASSNCFIIILINAEAKSKRIIGSLNLRKKNQVKNINFEINACKKVYFFEIFKPKRLIGFNFEFIIRIQFTSFGYFFIVKSKFQIGL